MSAWSIDASRLDSLARKVRALKPADAAGKLADEIVALPYLTMSERQIERADEMLENGTLGTYIQAGLEKRHA